MSLETFIGLFCVGMLIIMTPVQIWMDRRGIR
jgi:hypothetical protein